MDNDEQRDYEEEKYNREFCPECGYSPCILTTRYDPHLSARLHELEETDILLKDNKEHYPNI